MDAPQERGSVFCFPWMASRNFDVLWYFAPIFVAIAATYLLQTVPAAATGLLMLFIVNAFGVGPAHQGPTWFFYFDKRNREYWSADKKRAFLYYVAPALVFVATVGIYIVQPIVGFLISTVWGLQHFVQQNFGMTLLYHNKNNNEALPTRNLLLRSLWTPSILFVSFFFYRQMVPGPMAAWGYVIFSILSLVALYDVGRYAMDLRRQVIAGARLNVPAAMFWLVAVLYYVPFTFPWQRIEIVYLIPGTMHWFQYIGLNLILVKEKYGTEERKNDIPCGAWLLTAILCIGSTLFFLLNLGVQQEGLLHGYEKGSLLFQTLLGVYVGLSNVHYFQDAFFWRFREKFQRESIMPYLMQARKVDA